MTIEYAELHCHTAYSLLDGASLPGEMVNRAARLDYRAIALADHDGLHGAMEFAQAAKNAGIQSITGAELTLSDGSHLTLLVETASGYANLCRLITEAYMDNSRTEPFLTLEAIEARAEGLILLTGCQRSQLVRAVDAGRLAEARTLLFRYQESWGARNVFVELQNHLVQGDIRRVRTLARLAAERGLPCVATGNVHYHDPQLYRLQDVLVAINHRRAGYLPAPDDSAVATKEHSRAPSSLIPGTRCPRLSEPTAPDKLARWQPVSRSNPSARLNALGEREERFSA